MHLASDGILKSKKYSIVITITTINNLKMYGIVSLR
jgi:hypothetical protein